MSTAQEFYFPSSDGVHSVHVQEWLPEGQPRAVVQLVHGIAEHVARYDHLARFLTAHGYYVCGDDHLGHGKTAAGPDELGYTSEQDGWTHMVDDLHALRRLTGEKYPGIPYLLLGHSMGSFLSRTYLIRYPGDVDACALSGTGQQAPALVAFGALFAKLERARLGSHGRSALIQKLCFGAYNNQFKPVRTPNDWISRDDAVVDAYNADPFCQFWPTVTLFGDMMGGIKLIAAPDNLSKMDKATPVYFFSGALDPVGDSGKGVQRAYQSFLNAGCQDVSIHLYPNGRHEILNELNREEVYSDLLAWMESRLFP